MPLIYVLLPIIGKNYYSHYHYPIAHYPIIHHCPSSPLPYYPPLSIIPLLPLCPIISHCPTSPSSSLTTLSIIPIFPLSHYHPLPIFPLLTLSHYSCYTIIPFPKYQLSNYFKLFSYCHSVPCSLFIKLTSTFKYFSEVIFCVR